MPLSGTYTLLVEGRFNDAGTPPATYTVNVQPVVNPTIPLRTEARRVGTKSITGVSQKFNYKIGIHTINLLFHFIPI